MRPRVRPPSPIPSPLVPRARSKSTPAAAQARMTSGSPCPARAMRRCSGATSLFSLSAHWLAEFQTCSAREVQCIIDPDGAGSPRTTASSPPSSSAVLSSRDAGPSSSERATRSCNGPSSPDEKASVLALRMTDRHRPSPRSWKNTPHSRAEDRPSRSPQDKNRSGVVKGHWRVVLLSVSIRCDKLRRWSASAPSR